MWQRFSGEARRAIFHAQELAKELEDGQVSSAHLLIGLCKDAGTAADRLLARLGISQQRLQAAVEEALPAERVALHRHLKLTEDAKRIVDLAYDEARLMKERLIGTEHLLIACIRSEHGIAPKVLAGLGVELGRAREALLMIRAA